MLAGYTPAFAKQSFETYKKVDAPPAATLALALALTTRHSHHQVLEETWDNPKHFDKEASDLVNKLLTKPVKKRIGSGKTGAEDIKKHKWFRGLNWAALYNKQLEPPITECSYVPKTPASAADTTNFPAYPTSNEQEGPLLQPDEDHSLFGTWDLISCEADIVKKHTKHSDAAA